MPLPPASLVLLPVQLARALLNVLAVQITWSSVKMPYTTYQVFVSATTERPLSPTFTLILEPASRAHISLPPALPATSMEAPYSAAQLRAQPTWLLVRSSTVLLPAPPAMLRAVFPAPWGWT